MPSRIVCFVCGSLGGEYPLHSRVRESGAYFPFLEHHEPPKGSRVPGPDGVVDSCRVCYAFLTQQWETYERTNTPAIKRLYWLKRLDDGQFTGAEMKLQGEYMAQVMGLQYQPACGDNCAPLSPDESTSFSREGFGISGSRERKQQEYGEGVLDLSIPVKLEHAPSKKVEKRNHCIEEEKSTDRLSHSKPVIDDYSFICYTCGAESQGVAAKFISSVHHTEHEQSYPFLAKLTPPKGALPLNSQGICQVCDLCFSSLHHQWLSYEHHGTPNSARIFKVNGFFFSNDSSITMAASDDNQNNAVEVCYLCSQSYPQSKVCPLFTSACSGQEYQMYFPFIRELRRPNGARPLNPDGSVRVCINCFQNLQIQWQHYEAEKVPFLMRRYSVVPSSSSTQGNHSKAMLDTKMVTSEPITKSPMQPLSIEINKTPELSLKSNSYTAQLLASTQGSSTPLSSSDLIRQQSNDVKVNSVQTVPHPLLQAGERPKKVCFICGEKCLISKMQTLYSYPAKHEASTAGGQLQSVPFFPFLANREPASHADPLTEEGTVTACSYCFYSLFNQWRDFEESKNAADKNRWLRKYITNEFVCYVCSLCVARKKMRTLEVQKFQFLRDHKAPHGALVMWGGEAVGACGSCHFSLTHQYAEYERLGLPLELRKYNWTIQTPAQISENSNDGPENCQGQPSSGNEDSNLSMDDALGGPSPGHSGKPPFSLMSPGAMALAAGASKLPLKTATVPPLSHVTSSNGLPANTGSSVSSNRTSSFAAALRKLAHQAKDPAEESGLKSTQSPPAAHSPRATTPKRSNHPLALPSHSLPSTMPAPPVVTIAPTPAHHHHHHSRSDSRQTLDMMSSSHGCLPYDVGSGKTDREHHSLGSYSLEEDKALKKESLLSRTSSRMYPQVSSTSNGLSLTSQALDMYNMGFSPYRLPTEEESAAAAHHGLSLPYGIDPAAYAAAAAAAAAAYHPALLHQHPAFVQSPFRLDDPILLERYRLLQSPYFPFSMGAGLLQSHPSAGSLGVNSLLASAAAAAGQRYPTELLQQHYPYLSSNHPLMDPRLATQAALLERSRVEEDKVRDKMRERELEQEKGDHEVDCSSQTFHRAEEREAGQLSSDRSKADLLTIPSRAVHPMARDPGSHHYHFDEQETHSRKTVSPSINNHRMSYHVHDSYNKQRSTTPSSVSHPQLDHSQGKLSHPAMFSYNKTTTTSSHQSVGHRNHHYNSHYHIKSEQDYNESNSLVYKAVKHSSSSISPSKVSLSHDHLEKKPKHSVLFRPFDEPKTCVVEKEETEKNHLSSHTPFHLPLSSRPTGHSSLEMNSHFPSSTASLHDSKTSGLLSIPVLRVPPQHHSMSRDGTSSLFSSTLAESKANPPLPLSSHKPLSHCISDRVEKFDFKSLARECTSTSSPAAVTECSELVPPELLPLSSVEENQPVKQRSKLDVEEKLRQQAEKSEDWFSCNDDDVDLEERLFARLTMIGRVTPLPLDTSEDKTTLMEAVGLTTRMKRKELQVKKEARRRRQQRLSSTSPVLPAIDQTEEFQCHDKRSHLQLYQRLLLEYKLVDSNKLNEESDVEEKAAFLGTLGLQSSSKSHRAGCDNYLKRKYAEIRNPCLTLKKEIATESVSLPESSSFDHEFKRHRSSSSHQASGHQTTKSSDSQSHLEPSVIFSNVNSWLLGNHSNEGKYDGSTLPKPPKLHSHSSAELQSKNGVSTSSSNPFLYRGTSTKLDNRISIPVPSRPIQWNLGNKSEMPVSWPGLEVKSESYYTADKATNDNEPSLLPSSGHHSIPGNSLNANHTANPFTHPVASILLEDKHRLEGEQSSSYELSIKNLKTGFHNLR